MPQRYQFSSTYAAWDREGGPARKGRVVIRDSSDGSMRTYDMTPGELRQAIRHFVRALAFTKEVRRKGQHESTWKAAVDRRVEPIATLVNSLLPKSRADAA